MIVRLAVSGSVGVCVTTFIIRSLSVEDYGIYNILFALMGYVSLFASFGLPQIFQRFIPEAYQQKDFALLKQIVWRGLVIRLALSVLAVALILLLSTPIGRLLKIEGWEQYFRLFAVGMICFLEIGLFSTALNGMFLHKYSVIGNIVWVLLRGALMAWVIVQGYGLTGVLWAEVASWAVWFAVLLFFYHQQVVRRHPTPRAAPLPLKRLFRYGGFSFFNEMGSSILSVATDVLVISAFLGPAAAGIYGFCNRVVKMFSKCLPHVVLQDVLRPAFFIRFAETGDLKDLERMFNLLTKISAFFLFPFAAGVLVLSDKMIPFVFGDKYSDALIPLWIVVTFSAINAFMFPLGLVLQSLEKVDVLLYSKAFAIYNLIGDLLVVKPFGVVGVALVTCSAVLLKNLFCLYFARKYTGLSIDWRGFLKVLFNTAVMTLLLVPIRPFVTGIAGLIVATIIGCVIYGTIATINRAFTERKER